MEECVCGAGGIVSWVPVHSSGSVEAGLDHQLPVSLCHLWIHDWRISHHCFVSGTPCVKAPLHCQALSQGYLHCTLLQVIHLFTYIC